MKFSGQWTLNRGLEPPCRTQKQKHYPALWSPDLSFSFHQHTSPSIKLSVSCTLSPSFCARLCLLKCVWISVCSPAFFHLYTSTMTIMVQDCHCSSYCHMHFDNEKNISTVWIDWIYWRWKGLRRVWPLTLTVILCSGFELLTEEDEDGCYVFVAVHSHWKFFISVHTCVSVFPHIFFSSCVVCILSPRGISGSKQNLVWGLRGDETHTTSL